MKREIYMRKVWLSGVALAASLALAGTASAQIKVGVAGPLTGPNAAFGAQLKNGAEQAAADINAAGGINGQKIELVFGDDVSDPKQGVSVANKFVGDGVKFVIDKALLGETQPVTLDYISTDRGSGFQIRSALNERSGCGSCSC